MYSFWWDVGVWLDFEFPSSLIPNSFLLCSGQSDLTLSGSRLDLYLTSRHTLITQLILHSVRSVLSYGRIFFVQSGYIVYSVILSYMDGYVFLSLRQVCLTIFGYGLSWAGLFWPYKGISSYPATLLLSFGVRSVLSLFPPVVVVCILDSYRFPLYAVMHPRSSLLCFYYWPGLFSHHFTSIPHRQGFPNNKAGELYQKRTDRWVLMELDAAGSVSCSSLYVSDYIYQQGTYRQGVTSSVNSL